MIIVIYNEGPSATDDEESGLFQDLGATQSRRFRPTLLISMIFSGIHEHVLTSFERNMTKIKNTLSLVFRRNSIRISYTLSWYHNKMVINTTTI